MLRMSREPALFKPKKTARELSQIVSSVTDRKFACPPQCVGGVPSEWRNVQVQWGLRGQLDHRRGVGWRESLAKR